MLARHLPNDGKTRRVAHHNFPTQNQKEKHVTRIFSLVREFPRLTQPYSPLQYKAWYCDSRTNLGNGLQNSWYRCPINSHHKAFHFFSARRGRFTRSGTRIVVLCEMDLADVYRISPLAARHAAKPSSSKVFEAPCTTQTPAVCSRLKYYTWAFSKRGVISKRMRYYNTFLKRCIYILESAADRSYHSALAGRIQLCMRDQLKMKSSAVLNRCVYFQKVHLFYYEFVLPISE